MEQNKSLRDILSGLIFVGFGIAFGAASLGYNLGTALRMGPGFFPLVLAVVLAAFGIAIAIKGLRSSSAEAIGAVPWRGILLLTAALLFFGATIRGLGLAPTLFVTVFLTALASRRNGPLTALALAAGMTLLCVLIFSYGLGVAVPVLGTWLGY
jgi:Tripartite tricarboxylate transporter TctB family